MGQLRRQNKVVPDRQFVIETDAPGDFLMKRIPDGAFCFVDSVRHIGIDLQSYPCGSFSGSFASIPCISQRAATPVFGDLREKHVLYGIMLGAVKWKMHHEDLYSKVCGEVKEVLKEIISNVIGLVCQCKERTAALHDLDATFKYMHRFVRKQLCYVPIPMYDNAEIREQYAVAKRVTLLEHVMGSNDKGVIKYYHALIEHIVWLCRMLMRHRASQFLMHMVDVLSREFDTDSQWATSYNDEPTQQQEPENHKEPLPLIEQLAENVHNKWMQTRLEQGWTYGPQRNDTEKKHPCLIPYADLPKEEKLYDRNTATETVMFILGKGFRFE